MKQILLENETLILICLCFSVFRIYLEIIGFDFRRLPLTKKLGYRADNFHRYGLYFSIGYFILFAPTYF